MPRTPARKGDNLNFNGAKFINNLNFKYMRQEIEKEIEKLETTPFKKIYKTKKFVIDKQTKAGEVYIKLQIVFNLETRETLFWFSYHLNAKEIESKTYGFASYQEALLIFLKTKKMIKNLLTTLI